MRATLRGRGSLVIGAVALSGVAIWGVHHVLVATRIVDRTVNGPYVLLFAALYGLLVWQMALAYAERPIRASLAERAELDLLNVAALVPAYNEDPPALKACIESMLNQTRLPQTIVVVDDGSASDYTDVRTWFEQQTGRGVRLVWIRQDNAGKRHAQAAGVRVTPDADIYWTTDSDSIADHRALARLLAPFKNSRVQSVAGVVMALNVKRSFVTRIHDLLFVTSQLLDRSALSKLGAVWVNSGPIAAYRSAVIRDNLDAYLFEKFFTRDVPFSDDSMLTLYAMLRGRTVQQPNALAFSLLPETMDQNWRMFSRWMRGSFIRSWWRIRYLPMRGAAWWMHALRWATTLFSLAAFLDLLVVRQAIDFNPSVFAWSIGVTVALAYAQTLRYLMVRRSDQTIWYQLGTWALTPVAVIWQMTGLRACRWIAIATVMRGGWGTRQRVEVVLGPA